MSLASDPLIPTALDTARLHLRLPRESDLPALFVYYGDAESMRYTVGRPLTEGEAWRALAAAMGHWGWRGYGPYVVTRREAPDAALGIVGLWYPGDWPEPEIKWALVPAARGQSLVTEAARAVRAVARSALPRPPISLIFRDNLPSIRVAVALGARYEREMEFRGQIAHIYRHAAED